MGKGDGFTVPSDWDESMGYAIGVVCFPNSRQWLINVKSAIYLLTRARAYDFETGYWLGIEPLTVDIWESFMSCDFNTLIELGQQHIQTQRMIVAALQGQAIDFVLDPLPLAIDYTATGLSNKLGPNTTENSSLTLQASLDRLTAALQEVKIAVLEITPATSEDLEDDLAKVWKGIDDITEVLGGVVSSAPIPL
jgi:hypothetical protein